MKTKTMFAALFLLAFSSASAFAGVVLYNVTLTGPGESPPNASPATGTATVTIDNVLNTMVINMSFSGLTGTTTASHIHCCTALPGVGTAGVATTTPTFSGFPLGVTSGTYFNTLDLTLASSYNPAYITANGGTTATAETALLAGIVAGDAYLNIHSSIFGGGEIRGFLVAAVPEPATISLVGLAIAGIALVLRKRVVLR